MKSQILALLLCMFSVSAFAQETQKKDLYTGLEKAAVIAKLGPPTATKKLPGNKETLFYITKSSDSKMHMYTFNLDQNGKVIDWNLSDKVSKG